VEFIFRELRHSVWRRRYDRAKKKFDDQQEALAPQKMMASAPERAADISAKVRPAPRAVRACKLRFQGS
jgi:hypothetical protein